MAYDFKLDFLKKWDWDNNGTLNDIIPPTSQESIFSSIFSRTTNQIKAIQKKIFEVFESDSQIFKSVTIEENDPLKIAQDKFQSLKLAIINLHHLKNLFQLNGADNKALIYLSFTAETPIKSTLLRLLSQMVYNMSDQFKAVEDAYNKVISIKLEKPGETYCSIDEFIQEFNRVQDSNLNQLIDLFSALTDSAYLLTTTSRAFLKMVETVHQDCPKVFSGENNCSVQINKEYYLNKLLPIVDGLTRIQDYFKNLVEQLGTSHAPGLLQDIRSGFDNSFLNLFDSHWFNEKNPMRSLLLDERFIGGNFSDQDVLDVFKKFNAYEKKEAYGSAKNDMEFVKSFRDILQTLKLMDYPIEVTNLLDPERRSKITIKNPQELMKIVTLYKGYCESLKTLSKRANTDIIKNFLEAYNNLGSLK